MWGFYCTTNELHYLVPKIKKLNAFHSFFHRRITLRCLLYRAKENTSSVMVFMLAQLHVSSYDFALPRNENPCSIKFYEIIFTSAFHILHYNVPCTECSSHYKKDLLTVNNELIPAA